VHQDKLVDNVGASAFGSQLGSNFMITAAVKQGVDPAKVEAASTRSCRSCSDGPTADELARARTSIQAGWIRGVERIGGFGGKADALAECAVYTGDPGCFRDSLKTLGDATVASVRATGNTWLGAGKGSHTLVVNPGKRVDWPRSRRHPGTVQVAGEGGPKYKTTASAVDRRPACRSPPASPT
jgi:zinc protease